VNDPPPGLVVAVEGCDDRGETPRRGEGGEVEEPDPRTVRAAAQGDLAAFEALVRAYQTHVWRFLRHLLGDAALAEDCTQETFLRIHRRLTSFRFRSKFSTWVFTIARNAGIDALRGRERRARLLDDLPPPAPTRDPADRVEIAAAVASLPDKLREAFVLVEVLGLTYREAGEAGGAPEGTMKSRVFRARAQLVAWMQSGARGPGPASSDGADGHAGEARPRPATSPAGAGPRPRTARSMSTARRRSTPSSPPAPPAPTTSAACSGCAGRCATSRSRTRPT
jgi:RNA polymerase sigma-70 factor, ECF subfamily